MADQKLRYTIELDSSKATPELQKFLAQLDKLAIHDKRLEGANESLLKSYEAIGVAVRDTSAALDKLNKLNQQQASNRSQDAVRARFAALRRELGAQDRELDNLNVRLSTQLPLWTRLSIGITGVNQALSLLDRTVGRAGRALVNAFDDVANEGERLLNLSRRFDQPVEAVAKLDVVARRAGTSFEAMSGGMRLFAVQLAQARGGQEQALRLFRALGVQGAELETLAKRGLVPAFLSVAQRLANVSDGAAQAAIGARLFRGSWDAIKVVLADTNGDIDGAAARMERLSHGMSEELAQASNRLNAAFFDLNESVRGLFARLAEAGVFDAVAKGVNSISEAIANIPDETVRELGDAFADVATALASFTTEHIDDVTSALGGVVRELGRIVNLLRTTAGGATVGALLGSVIPGVGTLAGASVGGLAGLAVGFTENRFTPPIGEGPGESPFRAGGLRGKGSLSELRKLLKGDGGEGGGDLADLFGGAAKGASDFDKALENLREQVTGSNDQLAVLTKGADANTLAGQRMLEQLEKVAAASKQQVTPEVRALVTEFVKLQQAIQDAQQTKAFEARLQELRDQLALARGEVSKLDLAIRDAQLAGATPGQVAEFTQLQQSLDGLERFQRGAFDVFDAIGDASDKMFDGLIAGTLKMEDAFKSLKIGIVQSFVDAFKQGFAEKLGFENKFRVNIAQFVQQIGGILTGKNGLGGLFAGVFGPEGEKGPLGFTETITGPVRPGDSPNVPGLSGIHLQGWLTVIGSLVAIGASLASISDDAERIDKAAQGVGNAADNFKAFSLGATALSVAGFAAGGAAIGSVVPGLGTIVGAAIGAGIGAAISSAISSSISKAISGRTGDAIKGGLTQSQLNNEVGKDLLLTLLSGGNSRSELGRKVFLGGLINLLIPDIEDIFDKIFKEALRRAGLRTAGLGDGGGAGVPRSAEGLQGTAFQLSRVIGGAIGAGDIEARGRRFADIFLTGAAEQAARGGKAVIDVLFKVFRSVFQSSFADVFRIINSFAFAREKATGKAAEAFNAGFPTADFGVIAENLAAGADAQGRFFGTGTQKQAVKASRDAFAGLLASNDFAQFGAELTNVVRQSFAKGMGDAVSNAFAPLLLGELFQISRRASRKLRRDGLDALPGIASEFGAATQRTLSSLSDGGLAATLAEIGRSFKAADDALKLFSVAIAAGTGDMSQLREAIEGVVSEELEALRQFRDFVQSASVRTAALTGQPFATLEATRDNAGANLISEMTQFSQQWGIAATQLIRFLTVLAEFQRLIAQLAASGSQLPEFEALGELLSSGFLTPEELQQFIEPLILLNDLDPEAQAEQFRDLYDASLSYLEAEVELQNARIQFYGQAKKTFQDLIDQISVVRFGRFGQRGIFDRLSAELPQLAADLASDDESTRANAISRLQELGPQLLQLASQLFAPGSAAFTSFLDMITPLLDQAFDVSAAEEARAQALKDQAEANAAALQAVFGPILSNIETALEEQVGNRLLDVYNILAGEGQSGILGVLKAIAADQGVEFGGNAAGGRNVYAGYAYRVGERGPETFVASENGTIVPNSGATPGQIRVDVGGVNVDVSAGWTRDAIVDVVVDAMVRKTRPDLTRAVQVATGAR